MIDAPDGTVQLERYSASFATEKFGFYERSITSESEQSTNAISPMLVAAGSETEFKD